MDPSINTLTEPVNFGNCTRLAGPGPKDLAWIKLASSRPLTLYADAKFEGAAAVVARVVPLVTVEWGSGAATMRAGYRIVGRLRVPLVASYVRVEGRLVDLQGNVPPANVAADVSACIGCGSDGETTLNANTVVQTGADGILSARSERVLAVEGHSGGAVPLWLMLFEGLDAPSAGAVPRMSAAAGLNGVFQMRPASPREFVGGVRWAASSTPVTFTPAAGANLLVEAELLP